MATIEQRFGRRLRRVRKLKGETWDQLAEAIGVERTQVYRWERGKGGPQARQFLHLLQHYREYADYLVNGDPGEEPPVRELPEALIGFLETPLGEAIAAEGFTPVLSLYPFRESPKVADYRRIALILLGSKDSTS